MSVEVAELKGIRAKREFNAVEFFGRFAPILFLLVLVIGLSILEPGFSSQRNIFNVLRQVSITGIIAIGMTFVILTGGIDLSVGSVLAFAGVVGATVAKGTRDYAAGKDAGGINVLYAALACIGIGLLAGTLHGFVITKMRVPAFVATLGGLTIWRGATLIWTGGQPINQLSKDFKFWGQGWAQISILPFVLLAIAIAAALGLLFFSQRRNDGAGTAATVTKGAGALALLAGFFVFIFLWGEGLGFRVPVPVVIFAAAVAIGFVVLRYTQYGRWIYAIGGNAEAARLSGLNTGALTMSVYMISGLCAGLGGFLLTARLGAAEQVAGQGYELTVIAMVVIGGTSLFGGLGTVIGTLIGALLIGVLNNGLVIMNVDSYWQPIVIGVIVILSVYFDQLIKRRRRV